MASVLREGWEVQKLEDVCEIGDGNHSSKYPKKDEMEDSGIPFIRAKNMIDGQLSWIDIKYISEEKHATLKKGHLKTNDILFTNRGEIGKLAIVSNDFNNSNLNSQIAWFRCNDKLNHKFLFYFLLSPLMQKHYLVEKNGAALQQFTIKQIKNISFPIPHFHKQEKIVAILDEAFGVIDRAKANTELNLQNAKELFESYLQSVFENHGEGWEEKSLKDITTKIGSGATPKGGKSSYKEEGLSLVRSMNVHDFEFRIKNLAFINDAQAEKLSNVSLQKEDILLNITGASIARCCMIPEKYLPARVNQHVSIIRANKDIIDPLFLSSLLTSKFYKKRILEIGEQGATRQAITKVQLENFIITFPKNLDGQTQIVKKLNAISSETKKLESIYTQKLQDLEELKKSILQKAFNGELL